ncbi:MAG: hypothetical protein VZR95_07385 [Alphaproteobacteria bacterium]
MKSLRGYPATYSPISYEDVDITHLNYEEENTPKNYLEQIRYLLSEIDNLITRNSELYTKYQIRLRQLADKMQRSETDDLSISQDILNDMGISPSLEYAYNISPNKVIVNKKLPNVSNLYNELTAKTVYEKGRGSAGRQPTSLQNKNSAGRMRLSDLQTSPYYEKVLYENAVVNKKLPNVSDLYNELTPTQAEMMDNALRQGLGQSIHKNHPV